MASREARPPPKTTLKMFSCIGHWGLFHVNPKCLLLLDKTSVCIFSPGKSLPRSHIHLASVFFNPCSSSQLSRSTTFNSCLHIPCVVRTKMPLSAHRQSSYCSLCLACVWTIYFSYFSSNQYNQQKCWKGRKCNRLHLVWSNLIFFQ